MTDSALKVLEQTLLLGHVPGPTGACRWRVKADRSFARHAASEKQSQTRTRQRTPQHYECAKRAAFGFRRFTHYRIRALLYAGKPMRVRIEVGSIGGGGSQTLAPPVVVAFQLSASPPMPAR